MPSRCLTTLSVSLRSPSSVTDEQLVWASILNALTPGLRTLHLFLDYLGPPTKGAEPAVLQLASRMPRLRELKLSGPGCDMTTATLTRLQQALPYTAIFVEDV